MDMVFENQMTCQGKIEQNEQDEVEIAFDDLDDSNSIALNLDSSGHYQLQGESVTYRLVQLTSSDEVQHILSSLSSNQTSIASNTTSDQAEIQMVENNARPNAPNSTTAQDPPQTVNKKRQIIVLTTQQQQQQQNGFTQINNNNNTIYPKTLIPKNVIIKSEPMTKNMKDDRRRLTHKEVERRRRDKINMWILQLGNLIPDCLPSNNGKQPDSKGGILSKACEYITELQSENQEMEENLRDFNETKNHLALLKQQFEQLKQENQLLRSHLQQQPTYVDHALIPESTDSNAVVLLDDSSIVMESGDNNAGNFIGKYNFLSSNEDTLYGQNHCLQGEVNNENKEVMSSAEIYHTEKNMFHDESKETSFSNDKVEEPFKKTNNNSNLKTIILKNVPTQKRQGSVLRNQQPTKKPNKVKE